MLFRAPPQDLRVSPTARLSSDVALLSLAGDVGEDWRQHLEAEGMTLLPPFGSVRVDGDGGTRQIAALRLDRTEPHDRDPFALCMELDPESQARFLDFLLGFCRTAFRLGQDADFARTCARVARVVASDGGALRLLASMPGERRLLCNAPPFDDSTIFLIGPDSVRHVAKSAQGRDGLVVMHDVTASDMLVTAGTDPRRWSVTANQDPLPHILMLAESGEVPPGDLRAVCLRAYPSPTPGSAEAALLRELALIVPNEPRRHDNASQPLQAALELAIPDLQGGVFLRGWLHDPLRLIEGFSLVADGTEIGVATDQLCRFPRGDLGRYLARAVHRGTDRDLGFIAHHDHPALATCTQPILRLTLRSGAAVELVAPLRTLPPAEARNLVLSSVAPQFVRGDCLDRAIAPATERLHRAAMAGARDLETIQLGTPLAKPRAALLIPLYRNLGFLPFQLGAFATDPDLRDVELIFALDSPEQREETVHLLRGLHHAYGVPTTITVLPRNLGYAAATNAAARVSHAPLLLLLNSDVVPNKPGWLSVLEAARQRAGAAAAGPKLLFDDGSLQHAGLFFERDAEGVWLNRHYFKGFPGAWPNAAQTREVPAVTGAALLIERGRFERLGGVCEDFVIGDFEDSDLCLRLQEAGGPIVYVPDAELFHFERRSINLHRGYAQTSASAYNRHLHHRRWDKLIDQVMASHRDTDAAPGAA